MRKVFISSTVWDFEDLRGAIKTWLEDLGMEVFASETADFPHRGDQNSYDLCHQAIRQSDYFVLLIGERRGGLYSEDISITRSEYRIAYEEAEKRGLPIITFARQRVWDKKELYFQNQLLNPSLEEVHQYNFLKEVGKNSEMKRAAAEGAARPTSNWIHTFQRFSDLKSVLQISLGIKYDLRTKLLRSAIKSELVALSSLFLMKTKSKVHWKGDFGRTSREQSVFTSESVFEKSLITRKSLHAHFLSIFTTFNADDIVLNAIEEGQYYIGFAEHDPLTGETSTSEVQLLLKKLILQVRKVVSRAEKLSDARKRISTTLIETKHLGLMESVKVDNFDLVVIFSYLNELDRLQRIILSLSSVFLLDGKLIDFKYDEIPYTPIKGDDASVRNEVLSLQDAEAFLLEFFRE